MWINFMRSSLIKYLLKKLFDDLRIWVFIIFFYTTSYNLYQSTLNFFDFLIYIKIISLKTDVFFLTFAFHAILFLLIRCMIFLNVFILSLLKKNAEFILSL